MVTAAPDTSVAVSPVDDGTDSGDFVAHSGLLELPRGVAMLVVNRGSDEGVRFVLEQPLTRAGRHPENEIFFDDITVSRRHAEFVTSDESTTVRDVGLAQRYVRESERIEQAKLASGDEVQIGKFKSLYLMATGE